MSRSKYVMPIARVLTSASVLVTAGIRQASPEGSPLTVAIFGSAFVTMTQGAIDLWSKWREVPEIPEPAPLREIVIEVARPLVKETGTKFQKIVSASRGQVREVR